MRCCCCWLAQGAGRIVDRRAAGSDSDVHVIERQRRLDGGAGLVVCSISTHFVLFDTVALCPLQSLDRGSLHKVVETEQSLLQPAHLAERGAFSRDGQEEGQGTKWQGQAETEGEGQHEYAANAIVTGSTFRSTNAVR